MYKNIEILEITSSRVLLQKYGKEPISINLSSIIDFSKYDEILDYESETASVRIYKKNMIIKTDDELIKVYIPKPVRYFIIKDVQKKGLFSLTYRKHLYQEYDNEKHVLIKVNHIPESRDFLIDSAQEKVKKYSTGIYNMPLLICYYDSSQDRLFYNIVKENIVIETGFIDTFACNDHLKIAA